MYQVMGNMTDQEFFSENYNTFLRLLYMMQYSIFRCQFNGCAQDASNEWMRNKHVTYCDPTRNGEKKK